MQVFLTIVGLASSLALLSAPAACPQNKAVDVEDHQGWQHAVFCEI